MISSAPEITSLLAFLEKETKFRWTPTFISFINSMIDSKVVSLPESETTSHTIHVNERFTSYLDMKLSSNLSVEVSSYLSKGRRDKDTITEVIDHHSNATQLIFNNYKLTFNQKRRKLFLELYL